MRLFLRFSLIGLALCLAVAAGAHALSTMYYGADGQPAADMPVLYRIIGWNGALENEIAAKTGKDGVVKLHYDTKDGNSVHGYQIITGPDSTLHLRTREAWYRSARSTIEAKFTLTIRGTVVDTDGKPVPDARVVLGGMVLDRLGGGDELMEFNRPSANLETPAFVVTTDAKGEFAFPPVTTTRKLTNPFKAAYLSVRKEQGETVLAGETRVPLTWRQLDEYWGAIDAAPARVTVKPAETIRGMVADAVTGEPVAGATVCLVTPGHTSGNDAIPAVKTNDKGAYTLTGVLPGDKRLLLARKDEYGEGWSDAAVSANIALPPLVKVSGYIVDTRTANPPLVRTRILFVTGRELGEGMTVPGIHREYVEMNLKDGTFSALLPVGPVSFLVYPFFSTIEHTDGIPPVGPEVVISEFRMYDSWGTIPPEGLEDFQLNIKSQPYFHVFLDAGKEGTDNCQIYFRRQGHEHFSQGGADIVDGWWSFPAQTGWGETMEVQVKRWEGDYKLADASPIYTISANPDEGPFIIVIKPAGP
ncbi:MAG: carboxypeptidase-like regulatory domain-containing protein [Armatimonadota bacterium]